MTDARSVGRRIRDERLARELTQEKLADMLGTSRFRVIKWESGREIPNALYAAKLTTRLGIPQHVFDRATGRAQLEAHHGRLEALEGRADEGERERRDLARLIAELTARVARLEDLGSTARRDAG